MRAAEVEYEGLAFALEHQSQVQPAATFHEWWDAAEPQSGVQVGLAIGRFGRPHGGQDVLLPAGRDAPEETRRGQ